MFRRLKIHPSKHFIGDVRRESSGHGIELQLFFDGQQIEENVVLRTIAHRSTEHLDVRSRVELIVDENSTGGLFEHSDQTVEDGGLARAIRAEKRSDLILVEIEGDVVHSDLIGTEAFDQMFNANDRSRRRQRKIFSPLVDVLFFSLEEEIPVRRHSIFAGKDFLRVPRAHRVEDRTADHQQ